MKTKICTRCGKELPLTEFYQYKYKRRYRGKISNWCKICNRVANKQSRSKANYPPPSDPEFYKECKGCGTYWPATLDYYYKNKYLIDGLASRCKICMRQESKWRNEVQTKLKQMKV